MIQYDQVATLKSSNDCKPYADPFEDYSSSGSMEYFNDIDKESLALQSPGSGGAMNKATALGHAANMHESHRTEIDALKLQLKTVQDALKDKTVAKDILDANLKRILNAVNKLSTEKKSLTESTKELRKQLEQSSAKLLQYKQ